MNRARSTELARTRPRAFRVGVVGLAFALVIVVGYIDGRTSAYVAFSIFYVVPIFLASWYGSALTGLLAGVASAACGLAADIWSIGARPVYAYVNVATRLALFLVVALAFTRLRTAIQTERHLAARHLEVAEREHEMRLLREELMSRVAQESRERLGEIYSKVVDFGFGSQALAAGEARQVLRDLARASARLSRIIDTLEPAESSASGSTRSEPKPEPLRGEFSTPSENA